MSGISQGARALVVGVLVVLAGCGGDEPSRPIGPLAAPEHDLCRVLPTDVVQEHLGIAVREADVGSTLSSDTDTCFYSLDATGSRTLATALVSMPRRDRPRTDYLDNAFAAWAGETRGQYTKVDGLGEAAGFGRVRESLLFVVIVSDDVHIYRIDLEFVHVDVTVEQARPVAERMLNGLYAYAKY